ncbi:hypothetical protein [Streptomyces sp. NPDC002845]
MSGRSYAVDLRDGRIGEVMGRVGGYVQLRPVGGGREWDCPPGRLGEAAPSDVLRERVRRMNWDSSVDSRAREWAERPVMLGGVGDHSAGREEGGMP